MLSTKTARAKKKKGVEKKVEVTDSIPTPMNMLRSRMPAEFDDPETETATLEKPEVLPVDDETEELATEEVALDDEEVNPFGDKWEE